MDPMPKTLLGALNVPPFKREAPYHANVHGVLRVHEKHPEGIVGMEPSFYGMIAGI